MQVGPALLYDILVEIALSIHRQKTIKLSFIDDVLVEEFAPVEYDKGGFDNVSKCYGEFVYKSQSHVECCVQMFKSRFLSLNFHLSLLHEAFPHHNKCYGYLRSQYALWVVLR